MARYCIGIDLGGTNIKYGLLDEGRQPFGQPFEWPTPSGGGAEAVVKAMADGAREAVRQAGLSPEDVVGVGIGSPGPLSMSRGVIYESPNVPGMRNCPLRERIHQELSIPAALENDANAAALGEYLCGAGRGCQVMVLLTLGTGLGGGIVIDGKILHGDHEIGGEIGHMMIVPEGWLCGCGQRGCIEQYCSATFMAQRAERRVRGGPTGSLLEEILIAGQSKRLTSKDVLEAARQGDPLAAEIWDETAGYLALGCVNLARILDPKRIILGGGMANAGEELLRPVRSHFQALHWKLTTPGTEIVLAELGNNAGIIGAAGVAWQECVS